MDKPTCVIALIGDPLNGFEVVGPFDSTEAASDALDSSIHPAFWILPATPADEWLKENYGEKIES